MKRIYVEMWIDASLDEVWRRTQDPAAHVRWDARFHMIDYLPDTAPQRFQYATFGVTGLGVAAGDRCQPDGTATSVLRFGSDDPRSPIRAGSGYWRYVPERRGVTFVTGYTYRPGWGRTVDRLVRPIMGWLTAWSIDRLRLWLERGISPEHSRNQALAEIAARVVAVAAASAFGPPVAVVAAVLAVAIPPLPGTPAARRCRRAPRPIVRPQAVDTAIQQTAVESAV